MKYLVCKKLLCTAVRYRKKREQILVCAPKCWCWCGGDSFRGIIGPARRPERDGGRSLVNRRRQATNVRPRLRVCVSVFVFVRTVRV